MKKKCPKYSENQKVLVKRQCAWLYRYCRNHDFIIDDEKYFTLTHTSNDSFLSSPNKSLNTENVKYSPKAKFEPKVMLWLAISGKGMTKPYFKKSRLNIDQNTYLNDCIIHRLVPFINDKHSDNNYLFWPDKASSHYGSKVVTYLKDNGIKFVEKYRNPTNVPQCRPIEDFWANLAKNVYKNGWRADNVIQLKNRIRSCLKKMDTKTVTRAVSGVCKRLRRAGLFGPLSVVQ